MPDPCFPGSKAPVQLSYFSSVISLCLVLVITFGNASIILVVAKDPLKKLRTPFAFFLANAALSDLAVGIIAMPVSAVFHYREAEQKINTAFIYILHLTYFISATASLASMTAMAIDRHNTLTSIRVTRRKLPLCYCLTVSSLVWVAAFGFSSFYFLTGFVTLVLIYVNVAFVLSFGITLMTYVKVIRKMRSTINTLRATAETSKISRGFRATVRENKVTKTFMAMLIAFMSVYFPTLIFIYLLQFCLSCPCSVRHVFRDLAFLFVSAGSATNPIVCFVKMPVMRQSLYATIKRHDPTTQTSSGVDTNSNAEESQKVFVINADGENEMRGDQSV